MYKLTKLQIFKLFVISLICAFFTTKLINEFGFERGFHISILLWSFFVLCTPTTNGGIIVDIPYHLFTGKKPILSELGIWIFAISLNIYSYFFATSVYFDNLITHILYDIISTPWPLWLIIISCSAGTFYTVWVADSDGRVANLAPRIFSIILTIISLFITIILSYKEFIIMLHAHGNL